MRSLRRYLNVTNHFDVMKVGDKLPEVLGFDQNGKEIKSADFAGRHLILYAYPKDNTSGCTAEACSLRDAAAELAQLGYAIVGVSRDSANSHQRFIDKHALAFPLIADTDTSLLQQIGAWGEKTMCGRTTVGTLRTTLIVGPDGTVEHIFTPKQIKTKEHAAQIIDLINKR